MAASRDAKIAAEIAESVLRRLRSDGGCGFEVPPGSMPPRGIRTGLARINPEALNSSTALARVIDHTLLRPDATAVEVLELAEQVREFGFAGACVSSCNVGIAARALAGTSGLAIAAVGFPVGAALPAAKALEAGEAIKQGAQEIDMVVNLGALKSRDYALVFWDIALVVGTAASCPVKVILETSRLTHEEKLIGCVLAKAAGATYVKTSTGFGGGGASEEDVALMRATVGDEMGVKASGGIRSKEDVLRMIAAGASRIGSSASVGIVRGSDAPGKH